jgi:hypothetical protein
VNPVGFSDGRSCPVPLLSRLTHINHVIPQTSLGVRRVRCHSAHLITSEANTLHWTLCGMHDGTFGPYLRAITRILVSVLHGVTA